ncbi:MAG TPA: C39 family peptidase [Salinisphaeraceae bacterium]|nr:C39 family peptidase [Salinisphaeraceae bacterium]
MLLCAPLLVLLPAAVQADSVWLPGSFGGTTVAQVQSLKGRRFSRTIEQQYDFSCGSASVATLLSFHYHDPVTEQTVFRTMWENGDQAKIRREGFSLLDIKHYMEARGYAANGYEISLDKLRETHVPAIVLINDHGYNHFVVIKGVHENRVLFGDPSRGARSMSLERFHELMSNPIVFVITSARERAVFNGQSDWSTRPLAPLGVASMHQSLAAATVLRSGVGDF